MWVGTDEHEGVRAQKRPDVEPPPDWRLEAVAHTPRPRSLTIGQDRATVVFIQDEQFSDVYVLDATTQAPPERLTTGRAPMPYWDDDAARLSPDGTTVAYVDDGHVHLVPAEGGPPRKLLEGNGPVWVDPERLIVSVDRGDTTRLAVVEIGDPWPRRLAHEQDKGDEDEAAVSPDGSEVAYTFYPRGDLNRSEIRVADLATGATRAVTGTPRMHDMQPQWSPDSSTIAYSSERSGFYELHLVSRSGDQDRQLTSAEADHSEHEWHPDGDRIAAVRGVRNRFDLVTVDATTGEATVVAEGGAYGAPHWTASGELLATYEDHATPPELRLATSGPRHAPAPRAVKRARHARLEEVSFRSFDGLEIPALLLRPPA